MRTKRLLATVVAGCAVATPVVAIAGTAAGTAPALAAKKAKGPTKAEVTKGKALYASKCATCHGPKGEGSAGDGNKAYSKLPRAQSIKGVEQQLTSPTGGMPPVTVSSTEKKELAAYVTVDLTKKVKVAK
jgi:mono/diheme cytochrome c family protein